jgi:hypothetical protein
LLTEHDRPTAKITIDGVDGFWEHVATTTGREGWMFSGLLREVATGARDEAYLALWQERSKSALSLVELADLTKCLENAASRSADHQKAGALTLASLQVLAKTLEAIGPTQAHISEAPLKDFIAQHKASILFKQDQELGHWHVNATAAWDAEARYHDTTYGDALAWEAVLVEGGVNCDQESGDEILKDFRLEYQEYLARYPTGVHAREVLSRFADPCGFGVKEPHDLFVDNKKKALKNIDDAVAVVRRCPVSPEQTAAENALLYQRKHLRTQ